MSSASALYAYANLFLTIAKKFTKGMKTEFRIRSKCFFEVKYIFMNKSNYKL